MPIKGFLNGHRRGEKIINRGIKITLVVLLLLGIVFLANLAPTVASFETGISSDALESLLAGEKLPIEQPIGSAQPLEEVIQERIEMAEFYQELGALDPLESAEESETAPPAFIGFAPMAAAVATDWDSLRAAMADVNIDSITLLNNITRTANTAAANDLPAISRDLTIHGGGYTLNFNSNGTTAINRLGVTLGGSSDFTFTMSNMKITRTSTSPMVGYTGATDTSTSANSRFHTVVFEDIASNGVSSPLINVSDGTVVCKGTITWLMNSNYQMINARRAQFVGGATGSEQVYDNRSTGAAARILRMQPNANNRTYPVELTASNGAQVHMTTMTSNQVCWINEEARDNAGNTPAFVTVTGGALLEMIGVGSGTGNVGAVLSVAGGEGGYTITNGGILRVHSLYRGAGQPAIIQQVPKGVFLIDGDGSELEARSWGSSNAVGATIRLRLVGEQTFTVSNNAKVTVVKMREGNTTGSDGAALRFGSGQKNKMFVKSGGWVHLENFGNGTRYNPGTGDGYNAAVEYDSRDWTYDLEDEWSTVEAISYAGPGFNAKSNADGKINIGEGTIFIVSGNPNTNAASSAAFRANGGNTAFYMDRPLYYDFVNMLNVTAPNVANTGGSVFNLSNSDTMQSIYSDVAVWRVGVNRATGQPDNDWTLITYALSGTNQRTVSSSDPTFVAYYNSGASNSTKMENYTRISGNNAKPVVDYLVDVTNADKYVRAIGRVPEGRSTDQRPFWTDEVWGSFTVVPVEGGPSYTVTSTGPFATSLVKSYISENVYEVQTGVATLAGVLRLQRADGGLLHAGDEYTLTATWRAQNADDVKRHVGVAGIPVSVVVRDVTPPLPAVPDRPSIQDWQTTITGTWALADAWDNGPSTLTAMIKRGAAAYVPLAGVGTLNADGTWDFEIDPGETLAAGNIIKLILTDDLGNANPLVDTKFRDTTFPEAGQVIVTEANVIPFVVHYYYDGVEATGLVYYGMVTMPGANVNIGTDFPARDRYGYMFDSANPTLPAYIDIDHYTIRVYYVIDPDQKATVYLQYYFDGVLDTSYNRTITPQVLSTVTLSDVVLDPRPKGYELADPPTIPAMPVNAGQTDGRTIRVYYVSNWQTLEIEKKVTGDFANPSKRFDFQLILMNKAGTPLPAGTTFDVELRSNEASAVVTDTMTTGAGGVITFTLGHGDALSFLDISSVAKMRVIESNYLGFTPSYEDDDNAGVIVASNDTGVLEMDTRERNITFTNKADDIVPSGFPGSVETRNAFMISVLLIAGFVVISLMYPLDKLVVVRADSVYARPAPAPLWVRPETKKPKRTYEWVRIK